MGYQGTVFVVNERKWTKSSLTGSQGDAFYMLRICEPSEYEGKWVKNMNLLITR